MLEPQRFFKSIQYFTVNGYTVVCSNTDVTLVMLNNDIEDSFLVILQKDFEFYARLYFISNIFFLSTFYAASN